MQRNHEQLLFDIRANIQELREELAKEQRFVEVPLLPPMEQSQQGDSTAYLWMRPIS